jgi:hypothetical protein
MKELEDAVLAANLRDRPPTIKKNPDGTMVRPGTDPGPRPTGISLARKRYLDDAFRAVERKFQASDYDRAMMECDRVLEGSTEPDVRTRAEGLKRLIPTFQRFFEDGVRKSQAGARESALRPLQKARDAYQQIGLSGGGLGPALDELLLDALLASARSAVARGDLASAAVHYREAQRLEPGSEPAATGLRMVVAKAEELFGQAYQEKDTNPAGFNEKMRVILEIVPKTSPTWRKASDALGRNKGRESPDGR